MINNNSLFKLVEKTMKDCNCNNYISLDKKIGKFLYF